jgi:hypothetical protein
MLDFSKPDEILNVLLATDVDYQELADVTDFLLDDIAEPHENSDDIKYPSALSQCILECFKRINNFSSSKWVSKKKLKNALKQGAKPVVFSRITTRGEVCGYELYNFDQIDFGESDKRNETSVPVTTEFDDDKIKEIILACVNEFDGLYGRSGIANILKGSSSLKENDFNHDALHSDFFGLLKNKTLGFLQSKTDELIEEGKLSIKKGSFGRPLLSANVAVGFEMPTAVSNPAGAPQEEDENFTRIIKLIGQGKNIFITGHAGTGKSYILNKLKARFKKLVMTSTTGIAAVNIKGQTIHSWAGVGICNKPIDRAVEDILKSSVKNQIQKCKMLAVDEISMLSVKTFEYIDAVLRHVRANNAPFGGIQVIFIGDFFQLPPVEKFSENSQTNSTAKFCFESKLWQELDLSPVVLTKNYRQSEGNLITALSNMRTNSLSDEDVALLKSRETNFDTHETDMLHIFATNEEAQKYNEIKFAHINSREFRLSAIDGIYRDEEFIAEPKNDREEFTLKRMDETCRAEKEISLKIGCRVMLLVNLDFDKGLINGSCGVVEEIDENSVLINFDNGHWRKIQKHDFEYYRKDVLVAARRQFPLKLAYGITIHKSQGMTLENLVVDCDRIFEKGQAYVALSRIKKLEGLHLKSFNPRKVMVDDKVAEFYESLTT